MTRNQAKILHIDVNNNEEVEKYEADKENIFEEEGKLIPAEEYFSEEIKKNAIIVDGHFNGWINPELIEKYHFEKSAKEAWDNNGGGQYSRKNPLGDFKETIKTVKPKNWSSAKFIASKLFQKNPNAYFYRHLEPGQTQNIGDWGKEEKELFLKIAKKYGCGDKWGIFSSYIPKRVGYQCANYYRQVIIQDGLIFDPNYKFSKWGKPVYCGSFNNTRKKKDKKKLTEKNENISIKENSLKVAVEPKNKSTDTQINELKLEKSNQKLKLTNESLKNDNNNSIATRTRSKTNDDVIIIDNNNNSKTNLTTVRKRSRIDEEIINNDNKSTDSIRKRLKKNYNDIDNKSKLIPPTKDNKNLIKTQNQSNDNAKDEKTLNSNNYSDVKKEIRRGRPKLNSRSSSIKKNEVNHVESSISQSKTSRKKSVPVTNKNNNKTITTGSDNKIKKTTRGRPKIKGKNVTENNNVTVKATRGRPRIKEKNAIVNNVTVKASRGRPRIKEKNAIVNNITVKATRGRPKLDKKSSTTKKSERKKEKIAKNQSTTVKKTLTTTNRNSDNKKKQIKNNLLSSNIKRKSETEVIEILDDHGKGIMKENLEKIQNKSNNIKEQPIILRDESSARYSLRKRRKLSYAV